MPGNKSVVAKAVVVYSPRKSKDVTRSKYPHEPDVCSDERDGICEKARGADSIRRTRSDDRICKSQISSNALYVILSNG